MTEVKKKKRRISISSDECALVLGPSSHTFYEANVEGEDNVKESSLVLIAFACKLGDKEIVNKIVNEFIETIMIKEG